MSNKATKTVVTEKKIVAKNKKALRAALRRIVRETRASANNELSAVVTNEVTKEEFRVKIVAKSDATYDEATYFINDEPFSKRDAYSRIFPTLNSDDEAVEIES